MRGLIKALILGWIGKKIYDRTIGNHAAIDEKEGETKLASRPAAPAKKTAAAKKSAPKRTARKTAKRAA